MHRTVMVIPEMQQQQQQLVPASPPATRLPRRSQKYSGRFALPWSISLEQLIAQDEPQSNWWDHQGQESY
jgi:hypothetical protein